jgi:hypothetical protein
MGSEGVRGKKTHQNGWSVRVRRFRLRPGRWIGAVLLCLAILVVGFTVHRDPEPVELLLQGERYLNLARESAADLDAPVTFEAASQKLEEARITMRRQFQRPAFFRSYDSTRRLLGEAHRLIAQAIEESRATVADREATLRREIEEIRAEAKEVRALLLRLPPNHQEALRHVVSAESRTWAAEAKLTSEEMRDALENMRVARSELNLALQDVRKLLLGFFSRRNHWTSDLRETLSWTQGRGRVALVVDKLNHALHVVRGGRSVKTYPAEFGPGWLQQKNREGDNATPEGHYKVIRKKSRGQTRYYKALLLDYPNGRDTSRFERLRERGVLRPTARIGGLIEIHGEGGKGEDWTFGCVSLKNQHMDEIYPILSVGTPVTIVGVWEEPQWLTRILETASE